MKKLYNNWKKLAEKIGSFQATIIFSILYFIIFFPVGIFVRIFADYLSLKVRSNWKEIEIKADNLVDLKKQE